MRPLRRLVVVPCFNEARRLDTGAIAALVDDDTGVVFVDDGSTDDTAAVVAAAVAADPDHVTLLRLAKNGGKGEAVRRGLVFAAAAGASVVGFLDADLSTPVSDMKRVLAVLDERPGVDVVLGARVALLGRAVRRSAVRHYLGRVFATAASATLGLDVYDTQCGAKAFRATAGLSQALSSPFSSRWAFDVELLARLLEAGVAPSAFFELPLDQWRDVGGSKLTLPSMLKAGVDIARIAARRR